jgi:tripartite-type tricarboxylate transporter receptor subunit TctC
MVAETRGTVVSLEEIMILLRRLLLLLLVTLTGLAHAQSWPAKPVRWIVTQPPATPPDIIARLIGERLSRIWSQQLVVDNRAGGANIIGTQAAARSAPDGYTFLFATTAGVVINLYTFKSLPYDPAKDFVPVGMIGTSPFMLVANNNVPARTVTELIAAAKSQPDKLSFASDGQRLLSGMMGEALNLATGMKAVHVPYNGSAPALQDTIAGRTHFTLMGIPAVIPLVNRGQLTAIAVSSGGRLPGLEKLPTISETVPGFEFIGWFALLAPAGTPPEAIQRSNRDLDAVLKESEINRRLRDLGIYTVGAGTPQALDEFLRAERERWARTTREIRIEPE